MTTPRSRSTPQLVYQQDPIRDSVKSLGAKWTLLILRDIGFLQLNRFGEIRRNNPGLTARVLSKRLRDMQKERLILRRVSKDAVTYSLTPRGEDAVFVLLAFLRFGLKHHTSRGADISKTLPSFDEIVSQYRQHTKTKNS